MCAAHRTSWARAPATALAAHFERMPRDATFGNGRAARRVFEEMVDRQAFRLGRWPTPAEADLAQLLPEDVADDAAISRADGPRDPSDLLTELDAMVGLGAVKREVTDLVNLLQARPSSGRQPGLPAPQISHHLIFSGPPGTGKTTVARLYAELLHSLGVLTTRPARRGGPRRPGGPLRRAHRAAHQGGLRARLRRRAVHRRGVHPHPRGRRIRLRPGGRRHPAEADGGPPRHPRDRARIAGADRPGRRGQRRRPGRVVG